MAASQPVGVIHPLKPRGARAEEHRRTECQNYGACLNYTLDRKWRGFRCPSSCGNYAPPPPEQQQNDADGSARLVGFAFGPARQRDLKRVLRMALGGLVQLRRCA